LSDDARVRLPGPGGDAVQHWHGSWSHRDDHLCPAAHHPPDQPGPAPGAGRGGGGGDLLWLHPYAAAVESAVAPGFAHHYGGPQPDHHAVLVYGGHRRPHRGRDRESGGEGRWTWS